MKPVPLTSAQIIPMYNEPRSDAEMLEFAQDIADARDKQWEEMLSKQEPVAYVTGAYGGHFTYHPINPAVVLPVNMALYACPSSQPAPDLSKLKPDTQEAIRSWLADGTFVERAIGALYDQERELIELRKSAQPLELSDAEIDAAWRSADYTQPYDAFRIAVARAILRKAGKK